MWYKFLKYDFFIITEIEIKKYDLIPCLKKNKSITKWIVILPYYNTKLFIDDLLPKYIVNLELKRYFESEK